eukprot:TRINITY_DN58718_c0_g1_i1.p1 TRINITY_DN58718_c0_g1~~TRINITY_DN58718_c0_g1_i1.p1  ORF type:complete len:208 (+),score=41.62 TRINITY_DN58718_c0_g1_i1:32-655(+)
MGGGGKKHVKKDVPTKSNTVGSGIVVEVPAIWTLSADDRALIILPHPRVDASEMSTFYVSPWVQQRKAWLHSMSELAALQNLRDRCGDTADFSGLPLEAKSALIPKVSAEQWQLQQTASRAVQGRAEAQHSCVASSYRPGSQACNLPAAAVQAAYGHAPVPPPSRSRHSEILKVRQMRFAMPTTAVDVASTTNDEALWDAGVEVADN